MYINIVFFQPHNLYTLQPLNTVCYSTVLDNANFFFSDLGFTALSRIFHLYRADRSSKVGENRRTRGKTTWPSVSKTWLSHMWPERGLNHSNEKPNGLRVNSPIHQAMGVRPDYGKHLIKGIWANTAFITKYSSLTSPLIVLKNCESGQRKLITCIRFSSPPTPNNFNLIKKNWGGKHETAEFMLKIDFITL